jgi:hypothetical protein
LDGGLAEFLQEDHAGESTEAAIAQVVAASGLDV